MKNLNIYLDCNATTPVFPPALQAAVMTMRDLYGNPSSSHSAGLQAKYLLESTRTKIAQFTGSDPNEITFTSGATEAIQTAVFSAFQHYRKTPLKSAERPKILCGSTEHKGVICAIEHWANILELDPEIISIPVDRSGRFDLEKFRKLVEGAFFVSSMAVNNETGTIQDLRAIEAVLKAKAPKALWLVDCVQAFGKIPLEFRKTRINYACFSGHKFYAPKGVGFLYCKQGSPMTPLIVGGGQEYGHRSGTENISAIAALGVVLQHLITKDPVFQDPQKSIRFRDQLASALKAAFPKIVFNTSFEVSVPWTLNFSVPEMNSSTLLCLFDAAGVRVSAGSACSSKTERPSYVLEAMGLEPWRAASALRLSFGPLTTNEEIDEACRRIRECGSVCLKMKTQEAATTEELLECPECEDTELPAEELTAFLKNEKPEIIDVRDTEEFQLFHFWKELGFAQTPKNIPLSDIPKFLNEFQGTKNQPILFLCRSGARSEEAARIFQAKGFRRAKSLQGGIAMIDAVKNFCF